MKYKSVSCLVVILITLIFIFGCKKGNSKKDYYSGDYSFTTTTTSYPDSVIHYNGTISYDETSKVLTINYKEEIYSPSFPYKILPNVDDIGVLSYPDWTDPQLGYFFNGNIDFDGNINFKIGHTMTHHGEILESSNTVTGKKK